MKNLTIAGVGLLLAGSALIGWRCVRYLAWREVLTISEAGAVYVANTTPPGSTLLLGDSLTAHTYIHDLCGRPALNAAISGTHAPEDLTYIRNVKAAAMPSITVVAWGINDAIVADPNNFLYRIDRVLRALGGKRVVVGIWPVDKLAGRNSAFIAAANEGLSRLATKYGAAYVAPPKAVATIDGLHLTPAESIRRLAMIDARCRPI